MIKRKTVKKVCRKKTGKWAAFGFHGGKEGEQWSKGKKAVASAEAELKTAKHGIKAKYMSRVAHLGKLSKNDKEGLIRQIDRM